MIAPLKAGDHRFGHLHAFGKLLLRFTGLFAQLKQPARAMRGDGNAVVFGWSMLFHG